LAVGGGQSGRHPGPLRAQLRRGEREGEGEGESEERCPAEGKGSCVVRACETHQSSSWSSGKGIRRRTRRVTAGARRPCPRAALPECTGNRAAVFPFGGVVWRGAVHRAGGTRTAFPSGAA